MKGIDISANQGNINFDYVKSAADVVYIKATEGLTYTNPYLKTYYTNAKKAGLKIGFYHFMRANDPVAEAQHFLNAISGLEADCKYCIDCETTEGQSTAQISARVRKFADYLISQGKQVCLYTGESFYNSNLDTTVKDIPLWVAHYGVSAPGVAGWTGFQYSEKGSISGINGYVDLDTFTDGILLSATKNGWYEELLNGQKYWFCYDKGVMCKSQWRKDSKDYCYLNADGTMAINEWHQDSTGKWFYCGKDGRIVHNSWQKDSKDWCYLGTDGAMVTNTWEQDSSGKWFYCGSDGRILKNTTIDGHQLGADGARLN